jgi:acetylornithine deacetylase/succinyl-diaminopimelate desuccinylase-like protein
MEQVGMEKRQAISTSVQEQFEQQVSFLQRLVQVNSVNPFTLEISLATAPIEAEVAAVIHDELRRLGFSASLTGASAQRQNVICHVQGSGRGERTLILTTHMDTVEPTGYSDDPWSGKRERGQLYGVGLLKTVYTRAGEELTDPQEGCKLADISS